MWDQDPLWGGGGYRKEGGGRDGGREGRKEEAGGREEERKVGPKEKQNLHRGVRKKIEQTPK